MLYIGCWACHRGIQTMLPSVCNNTLCNNFFFRGSHDFLSACTLPKWDPELVATRAIIYYRNRLRGALEDLMASSKVVCNRTKSTQSSRLSLDSLEGDAFTVSTMDCEDSIVSHMSSLQVIQVRRPPCTSDPIPFSSLCLIMDPCQWCHISTS